MAAATAGARPEEGGTAPEGGQAALDGLYAAMRTIEGRLGGGEGVVGLYGSISQGGCAKVMASLAAKGGLGRDSVLVDVGAGLGRPLLHAMLQCRVRRCFGIEVDAVKCSKAEVFMDRALRQVFAKGLVRGRPPARPEVLCAAVEDVATLGEATHAYSFWEGLPPDAKRGLGRLVRASGTLRAFAVVQRGIRGGPGRRGPAEELAALGFGPVRLVDQFPVAMSGSGRGFTAYVFTREAAAAAAGAPPGPAGPAAAPTTARGTAPALGFRVVKRSGAGGVRASSRKRQRTPRAADASAAATTTTTRSLQI